MLAIVSKNQHAYRFKFGCSFFNYIYNLTLKKYFRNNLYTAINTILKQMAFANRTFFSFKLNFMNHIKLNYTFGKLC